MDDLIELAEAEGKYQDIEVNGEVVVKGYRSCEERWKIIEPHIKGQQTIMDIGSHYGYFAMKIANKYPTSLVWSIEETSKRAVIQKIALELNDYPNVVLSQNSVSLLNMLKLQRTCETLDTIMALSVIHYFPLEDIPEIIWAFSRLAQNLIIEFPVPGEVDVANKDLVDLLKPEYLLGLVYDSVTKIGETSSTKHKDVMRPIYLAQNYKITRENNMSYWSSHTGGHHDVVYENLSWSIDGKKKKYNGLNLQNLRHFNMTYPKVRKLLKEGANRYFNLIQDTKGKVTDIHPRNLIVSHDGVFPIDYNEGVGKPIYGKSWSDYRKAAMLLTEEEIYEGLKDRFKDDTLPAILNGENQ